MNSHDRKLYPLDHLEHLLLPPRTVLYPLEACGFGTGRIEGFCSYFARLANKHHIHPLELFTDIYAPTLASLNLGHTSSSNKKYRVRSSILKGFSEALNGINALTNAFVTITEQSTGQNKLEFLTYLPLGQVISNQGLLRKNHAWCPICYQEQKESHQPVYDLLAWSLENVRVCTIHQCYLLEKCPFIDCQCEFKRLASAYCPGFCPRCDYWLGKSHTKGHDYSKQNQHWEYDLFCAYGVEELITRINGLDEPLHAKKFVDTIQQCINKFASGRSDLLANFLSVDKSLLTKIKGGNGKRPLSFFLNACFLMNLSLADFVLLGQVTVKGNPRKELPTVHKRRRRRRAFAYEATYNRLLPFLSSEPPIPLAQVSILLDICVASLYYHFPEESARIVQRSQQYKDEQKSLEKQAIKTYLDNLGDRPISVASLSTELNIDEATLRRYFPDECKQISARFDAYTLEVSISKSQAEYNAVYKAAIELHTQNIYPSLPTVTKYLGKISNRVGANEALKRARADLGL